VARNRTMHPCYWKVGLRWALPSHAQCSDGSLATCHPRCGMTQKGHVVSSLEVLHPRSPSQQCSTSPRHDTEGAVRRFISTVSKAIPAVVSMASATHRRAKLKLPYIVDGPPPIVALEWQHRVGAESTSQRCKHKTC
jgi:hypothetical protein